MYINNDVAITTFGDMAPILNVTLCTFLTLGAAKSEIIYINIIINKNCKTTNYDMH